MKSQLYTRTGDTGMTSLVGGSRIKKNSLRLEAYGTIDELSSALGVIASDPGCSAEARGQLHAIQNELFNIGAYLATPAPESGDAGLPACAEQTRVLESWIDTLDEQTPPIRAFVLPGGCQLAASAHVARTICRRAERRIIDLAETEHVDPMLIKYINRLSDYLFILARYFNFIKGEEEIVWKK